LTSHEQKEAIDKVGLISINMTMHIISRTAEQVWQTRDCLANVTAAENATRDPQ